LFGLVSVVVPRSQHAGNLMSVCYLAQSPARNGLQS